jgi:hypothetical protein
MEPKDKLDVWEKGKNISCSCQESNHESSHFHTVKYSLYQKRYLGCSCVVLLNNLKIQNLVLNTITNNLSQFNPSTQHFSTNVCIIFSKTQITNKFTKRVLSSIVTHSYRPGRQRVHASKNNAVHSQQHILTQL